MKFRVCIHKYAYLEINTYGNVLSTMCSNPINVIAIVILQENQFNISIINVYAPTTDHSYKEIEIFDSELKNYISK